MKRKINHFEREAWIMAMIPLAIVVIGIVAALVVPWIGRLLGWHPH
ncbi:MAG: hypothetical protein ABIQ70_01155 [Dokdonella sp.]